MRLSIPRAALVVASFIGAIAPAIAEDAPPVVGNIGFASEYRFRGLSQTDFRPAIQGGADYSNPSGFYLGTWGSNISWLSDSGAGGSSLEWDMYGGYKGTVGDFSYDVGGLFYYYPGRYENGFTNPNTFEIYAAGGWKWFTLKYSYSLTNAFGFADSHGSSYLDLSGAYPIMEGLNLVGHVGHQWIVKSDSVGRAASDCSYTDWKLGLTKDMWGVTWGLAYIQANAKDMCYTNYRGSNLGKATGVLTITKTF